ncbi:MAG: GNAT family N-acetyltransferase [candidate division Zixibacteria bacterium]|nr:GNAT family N-acetyltransferase [candidate division Zixibacteria bacterium]
MKIEYKELKPVLWKDVEKVFGPSGGCAGCWCIWWRLPKGGKLWQETRGTKAKKMFQGLIKKGKAQGILAYADGVPVGWATFGPRTDFPRLETAKAYAVEDFDTVWSLPCFFIPSGFRNKGIARGLLAAVIKAAKKHKAKILEGYPVPLTKAGKKLPAAWSWTGPLKVFEEAGFKIVQRQSYSRPLVRKEL